MADAAIYQLPFKQDAGPHAPLPLGAGGLQMVSSFGLDNTTLGPAFDALGLVNSERTQELAFRESFYKCTQHDWKTFDFNGRLVGAGKKSVTQPLIGGSVPSFYVPLDARRPSTPYRLARKIVNGFTALLFGHGRFPQPRSRDPQTQDFAVALIEESALEVKLQRARTIGGSCGTVGLSWCYHDGKPRVSVHHGKNTHVLEWQDESERIPAHVTEIMVVERLARNPKSGKREKMRFWRRQDWTLNADVVFREVLVTKENPHWEIDAEQSYEHGHGECHFIYIENLPDEDDSTLDGAPDYAEVYEPFNSLDVLNSVIVRGSTLNLDPTLKLRMHPEELAGATIKKGSDNALVVGPTGDASYLELSGTSITAGKELLMQIRQQILEVSEAVVPDPDQVAAAGLSSVAIRMLYAPSLSKADILRHQYGTAIARLLNQMIDFARRLMPDVNAPEGERYVYEIEVDEEGNEINRLPVEYHVDLEPRTEEILDENGEPTGETRMVDRHPGQGRVTLEWGPYFKPTADDLAKEGGALTTAAGGKPVLSQRTAVERMSNILDRDATEEWSRVVEEQSQTPDAMGFGPMPGSDVPAGAPGTDGVEVKPEDTGDGLAVKVQLAPTDLAKIVTVNEARRGQGLGVLTTADGQPDPDGFLTIDEFAAKRAQQAEAVGGAIGSVVASDLAATVAPAPVPAPEEIV